MKKYWGWILICLPQLCFSQSVSQRLSTAIERLIADPQFKHAVIGISVVETNTGKLVYEKNAQLGLAPASCQKVITSAAAFELLGDKYRFRTELGYDGTISNGILNGDLILIGYGDPTLGSDRYKQYADLFSMELFEKVRLYPLKKITGKIFIDDSKYEYQAVPKGWVWEDIGNYYGAGCGALNWKENSFPVKLKAGSRPNDSVKILNRDSLLLNDGIALLNHLTTGAAGSGDNAFVKLAPYQTNGSLEGSIPAGQSTFTIKGAMPNPVNYFINHLWNYFNRAGIDFNYAASTSFYNQSFYRSPSAYHFNPLFTNFSPSLDSINYWFLKKSVNLYGEAFVKAIAYEKTKFGSTDSGIAIIKEFWRTKGIEKSALNILDGSGLSPANRVTSNALVAVMQYARTQPWYNLFFNALPEMNGIKMKDGYIGGVRAYTGYCKAANGTAYTFSFIANNFDGSPGTVREKMWKVLDILK